VAILDRKGFLPEENTCKRGKAERRGRKGNDSDSLQTWTTVLVFSQTQVYEKGREVKGKGGSRKRRLEKKVVEGNVANRNKKKQGRHYGRARAGEKEK